jgi:hypothetical protein
VVRAIVGPAVAVVPVVEVVPVVAVAVLLVVAGVLVMSVVPVEAVDSIGRAAEIYICPAVQQQKPECQPFPTQMDSRRAPRGVHEDPNRQVVSSMGCTAPAVAVVVAVVPLVSNRTGEVTMMPMSDAMMMAVEPERKW